MFTKFTMVHIAADFAVFKEFCKKRISHITFLNTEKHGFVVSEISVTFDLLCKDEDTGEEFLVEVQNADQKSYRDRVLAYATYPIREQLASKLAALKEQGMKFGMDYSLKPIYVISIVNFHFEHEDERALENGYISRYEDRAIGTRPWCLGE